jgi:uncharacterized protein YceK
MVFIPISDELSPGGGPLVSTGCAAGCATVYTLSSDRVEGSMYEHPDGPQSMPRVYSGLIGDVTCLRETGTHGGEAGQIVALCLIDTPLSIFADTLLLPFTIYEQVRFGSFRPRLVPAMHEEQARRREQAKRDFLDYCHRAGADRPDDVLRACREREPAQSRIPDGGGK